MPAETQDADQSVWLRDPDVQRMLRVRDGDDTAFTELVEAYQHRIVGIFAHLLPEPDAAEDLAQDVFLRIYRARERYQPTARFSTWLFRIANNLASNRRRSAAVRRELALPSGTQQDRAVVEILEKSALMPTRQFDRREMAIVVRAALETLSDRQRMALLLNKFEHMSYQDIALTMDLSPQAVKSLLTRARLSLKERLEPYL